MHSGAALIGLESSDRTDLSTESGSGPIQSARESRLRERVQTSRERKPQPTQVTV